MCRGWPGRGRWTPSGGRRRRPDPGLAEAFLRAIAGCLHVRGVYYARPGRDAAVTATVERLHLGAVNVPMAEAEGPAIR